MPITNAEALKAALDALREGGVYIPSTPPPDSANTVRLVLTALGRALIETQRERDEAVKRGDDWAGRVVAADEQGMRWKERAEKAERERDAFRLGLEALKREGTDDDEALRARMADLLTRTANALKGEPEPLHLHDWSDLPERAGLVVANEARLIEAIARGDDNTLRICRERDEARRHARHHHVEGGCLTCIATESERNEARDLVRRLARGPMTGELCNASEAKMREWGIG